MEMTRSVLLSLVLFLALGYAQSERFEFTDEDLQSDEAQWAMYERWRAHHDVPPEADDDEQQRRFFVFMDNVKRVDTHNKAKKSYVLELNRMSDLKLAEVVSRYTGGKHLEESEHRMLMQARNNTSRLKTVDHHDLPREVDWRQQNKVVPIKDQGYCGSCWAFAAMGAIESAWAIKYGNLMSLSEQHLVDCSGEACDGGIANNAWQFLKRDGGAVPTEDYPYTDPAVQGVCDKAKQGNRVAFIENVEWVGQYDEPGMMAALQKQPLSVCLYVYEGFQMYTEGVYTGEDCVGTDSLHCINFVGYGETPEGVKYWILRNSWGEGWGEKGYMKIARETGDKMGVCSLTIQTCYPIVTDSPQPIPQ